MNIGIEAERANHPTKTGVEHYAKELIVHLAKIDQANNYTLYLRTQPEQWFSELPQNFKVKLMPFPKFWTQIRLSWEMLRSPVDVLFVPASTLPLFHPKATVYTEHDVAWLYYPEVFTWYMRQFHRVFSWLARTSATKIIAISASTKKDLVTHYGVPENKIAVVPHGYTKTGKDFTHISEAVKTQLPEKYVLFLSTLQPRKNVERLIDAFRLLKQEHPELPHKLVIVGKPGWKFEQILRKIEDYKDIVVYLNHISDSDRWPVYHMADLFVHPSLYEGFGMWLLEAFECEVAATVSGNSSLPEVGGDAVLYFDPFNIEEIKNSIARLLADPSLREQLIKKGKDRLSLYSWERCAKETLAVLEEAGTS